MKKNKITFFAMELILLVLALFFVRKIFIQNVPEKRVAVILPESGDQRWDSLIKGMKQSAKENHIHLVICNTDDIENAEAEKEAIEEQKNNHIDAFIVLPAPGTDTKEMLTKECSDVPVILVVEDLYTEDAEATQDDPFINALADKLKENLKSMETEDMKITVSVKNGNDDQQDQNDIVEGMIDAGCDVLCVNLVDRTAPSRIIRLAKQNDIPIIFFNRELVWEDLMQWEDLYYVGCDAEQSGVMQGEIAADYIKNHPEVDKNQDGEIQYVLLEGEAGHQDAISRTDFSVKTLIEKEVNLEKLSYQFADWNRGQAENRMNRLISQYKDGIELVISNNDEMALGAVEAYRKAGYEQAEWPVIFGIDGLDDALEAIKAGEMQGTVYNDKEDQALQIAKLAVEIFRGEDVNRNKLKEGRYYVSEYQPVYSSNVEDFIKRQTR